MPTSYAPSGLAGLVDSDSEGELHYVAAMPTPDWAGENKRGRGRPKTNPSKPAKQSKITKTSSIPARRTSGRLSAKNAPVGKKGKRKVLADKTNKQAASETEEVEEFDLDVVDAMSEDELHNTAIPSSNFETTKSSRSSKKAAPRSNVLSRCKEGTKGLGREARTKTQRGDSRKKESEMEAVEPSSEKVIIETQMPEMNREINDYANEPEERDVSTAARNIAPPRATSRLCHGSGQLRWPGSATDTERNDSSTRRKLGEVTKKLESLEAKYRNLHEVGIKDAERNFEKYRKQSEQKTAAANKLIASLQADIASQVAFVREARGLQKQLQSQGVEISKFQSQIAESTTALKEVQSENKILSAKLASTRNIATSMESTVTNALDTAKPNGSARIGGSTEAAQIAQVAQLKEDLYSDLTGLITIGVKREVEEEIFDCIQTGRNGTLHFKLAVANEKSADSYDNAQCVYTPQLDTSRDKALISLLPDYLTDEITFPRPQAAKFYARVAKALTEKAN